MRRDRGDRPSLPLPHARMSASTTSRTGFRDGPEVPRLAERGGTVRSHAGEARAEQEVAAERLEHVLPGTHRARIPHGDGPLGGERAHGVRHDPVLRPVAATDDVPARAPATAIPCSPSFEGGKKLLRYEATMSSAAPFGVE